MERTKEISACIVEFYAIMLYFVIIYTCYIDKLCCLLNSKFQLKNWTLQVRALSVEEITEVLQDKSPLAVRTPGVVQDDLHCMVFPWPHAKGGLACNATESWIKLLRNSIATPCIYRLALGETGCYMLSLLANRSSISKGTMPSW